MSGGSPAAGSGPLAGLRVVDCTSDPTGWRLSGLLADYGADVVWVEPEGGDPGRARFPVECAVYNRGKRSVVLADQDPGGPLGRLLEGADVLVEMWPSGAGAVLTPAEVADRFPTLVHCSISGFGLDGPDRLRPAYEPLVHAVVGTMAEQIGHRDGPIFEGLPFASMGAAHLGSIGVLAALHARASDGRGRHVETSLLDGALAYLALFWGDAEAEQAAKARSTADYNSARATRLITGSFLCGDGEYLGVHTGAVGGFGRLMAVLGLDDRIPPSASGIDMGTPLTPAELELLNHEIHVIFASEPRDVWLARLVGADVCAIPQLHAGEVFDQPQTAVNEMVVRVSDPVLGELEQVAPAVKLSRTPGGVRGGAPRPGADTEAVLADLEDRAERPWCGAGPAQDGPLLEGIHVLDLGAYFAGPYASRLLADLGADVIKLEPVGGDPLRPLGGLFRAAQANKRSIAVDLRDAEAAGVVAPLLAWADVVHHNMRPGAAERIGVGYDDARAVDESVVYGYAPGWGSLGPWADRQSFEPMMSGYVGAGYEVAGQYNPPLYPAGNSDPGNGLLGAVGILLALLHRRRTGEGQRVEHAQLNATMTHMSHVVRDAAGTVLGADRLDPLQFGFSALERLYETADGWLCLAVREDGELVALEKALGVELVGDARFATPGARSEHDYDLSVLIGACLAEAPTAMWVERFAAAGAPAAPPAPYNNHRFLRDPENQRSGRVVQLDHPDLGVVRELAVLVRVSGSTVPEHRIAPSLGEHTRPILRWAGFDDDVIDALEARGSVRCAFEENR